MYKLINSYCQSFQIMVLMHKKTQRGKISMPKVPNVGEEKRYAVLVAAVYRVPVSDAPSRLCNNTDSALTCFFHGIVPS